MRGRVLSIIVIFLHLYRSGPRGPFFLILHLIQNAALLLSLCCLQSINNRFLGCNGKTGSFISGLLYGLTCVIGMMSAIELEGGWIFDARSVVLSMAAIFGGPLVAVIAGFIAAAYRFWLGGAGMWGGISVIVLAVLLGWAYRYFHSRNKVVQGLWSLLFFGLLLHILMLINLLLQSTAHTAGMVMQAGVAMLLVMPVATVWLGWMLVNITRLARDEQELRIAATAFEIRQGLLITDPDSRILRVNRAFSTITGYQPDEVIGQKSSILSSGRHDAAFYRNMWQQLTATDRWQGEVWNQRKNGEIYPEWLSIVGVRNIKGQLTHYVASIDDVTKRKAAEARIRHLALFDTLTDLPNRNLLLDRVQHAINTCALSKRYAALLFFNFDGFKGINDLHGRQFGDELLCRIATRLSNGLRSSDTLARLGADEFVVMVESLDDDRQEATTKAEQCAIHLKRVLGKLYRFNELELHSRVSIGITLFNDAEHTGEDLIQQAEMAMHQAKAAGKDAIRFFDPTMQETVSARLRLEEDIRRGLQAEEFIPYLQPQLDERGRVLGAEVLARWQHPQRGLLTPGVFIEVAEQVGMVEQIDLQMLYQACHQLALWRREPATASLSLAVNLSARLLYQPDFIDQLLQILALSGANPQRLKLELTETILIDDMSVAIARMHQLREHGIRFSIDDFGTGYSSLAYLQKLPLDQLKIDQSFVRDMIEDEQSLAIIRAICALAASLQLEVIAEGVETQEQHAMLQDIGCGYFQGYLFGRPMPLDEFERLLMANQPKPSLQLSSDHSRSEANTDNEMITARARR